jgi:hypothetical protein
MARAEVDDRILINARWVVECFLCDVDGMVVGIRNTESGAEKAAEIHFKAEHIDGEVDR